MMEKGQKKPQSQLAQRHNNFPVLRKSNSLNKPIISLAKVELDSHMAAMEYHNSKSQSRQILTSFSHKRIGSGVSIRQLAQSNFSKTSRSNFHDPRMEPPKKINSITQQSTSTMIGVQKDSQKDIEKHPVVQNIDKAKVSSKAVGHIKGYAVNSHPGPLSTTNQDRICIVTNLNRSACRENQISFFSIYDGKDGAAKAEYFRDNFHNILSKDGDLLKDIQKAIRKTFCIMDQGFKQSQQGKTCPCDTCVNICLVIDESIYFIQTGSSKVVVSRNFGEEVGNIGGNNNGEEKKELIDKAQPNKYRYYIKSSQKFQKRQEVVVRKIGVQQVDFIVLGSEGLFQNLKEKNIGHRIWKTIVNSQSENIHMVLGQAINVLMHEVFSQICTKNVSLILISFGNVVQCCKNKEDLLIPYVEQSEQTTQQV